MDLKFYLNKFVKVDNIENYTLKCLFELRDHYDQYLDKTDGTDPDFPMMTFGNGKGKKVNVGRSANDGDSSTDSSTNLNN